MEINLSIAELTEAIEEYANLRNWMIVRNFCNQVYGENKIALITLETYGEYNDGGGTDYQVDHLVARPIDTAHAEFDLSLPFWQWLFSQPDNVDVVNPDDSDALDMLKDWYETRDDEELVIASGWVHWKELPCDVHSGENITYDLTQTPKITYPIFV